MKVFIAGTSLLPSYGGPAFSVSRLATALTEAGAEVGLWAPDQSAGFTSLLAAQSSVRRLTGTEAEALDSFGEPDILHDNGIWRPHNHRLAALAESHDIPRVVSTRGMLEPWAINHKTPQETSRVVCVSTSRSEASTLPYYNRRGRSSEPATFRPRSPHSDGSERRRFAGGATTGCKFRS